MILWIGFAACTMVIVYSGIKLAKYGDIIAEKTGLGKTLIGMILMAAVTSLPELITGISSVTYAGVPDIAAGDVLGSCVFNLLILVVLDFFYRPMPLSSKAHRGNILSAGFGILLLSVVALGLFLGRRLFPLGWIGPYSLLIIGIYIAAVRMGYSYEKKQLSGFIKGIAVELKHEGISRRTAFIRYGQNAFGVVVAAIFLPFIAEGLAKSTGLGQTFVGNTLVALATSLPELVVCLAAVKMDAVDLAIGNIFGSNIFNVLILAVDDLFFIRGPILSLVDPNHIISALFAVIMTAVAIIGLMYRAENKFFLAWDSMAIGLLYLINLMMLFMLK